MILELDLGNTYCKWRILDVDEICSRGLGDRSQWLEGEFPAEWPEGISRVRIGSVVGAQIEQELDAALRKRLNCPVYWVRSGRQCAGVKNIYPNPEKLGVDRWLAMIAAYQEEQAALMICDIGSALTIDVVDVSGLHRGGYIVPGPRLMREALLSSTDRVRFETSGLGSDIDPGTDTASCVGNGIAAALCGAAFAAYHRAQVLLGGSLALYVTGGHRDSLIRNLEIMGLSHLRPRPELVLDGLRWAAP